MHFLYNVPGWDAALVPGLPQPVLAVDRGDMLVHAAQVNPAAFTMLRHCDDSLQVFSSTWEGSVELAQRWWASFVDRTFKEKYAPYVKAVKGYNETLANSQNAQEKYERYLMERALAYVWNTEYRVQPEYEHIRPILASAAVGNDIPEDIALLSQEFDTLLSYHAYMYWDNKERPDWEMINLTGRWVIMEEDYVAAKPTWVFTEGGPFESSVTGWRSEKCLDGDIDMYVEAMRTQFREIKATQAWQDGRVIGPPVWFTTGGGDEWKEFFTNEYELNLLGQMLAEEWEESPSEIPSDDKIEIWQRSIEKQISDGLSLNPDAALQKEIFARDMVPVMSEWNDEEIGYIYQAAEHLGTGERLVFVWLNGKVEIVEKPD